ncbi:M56 family metallopeptidase [Mucilaginibacter sp. dw_454]|uniref:M56 family metallopeptidase n=1 Tax=Mucilaginibacter sp. dw_454 TaxID=2720079 RepID=UPI001BD3A1EF|nr:M56 family metallopeptidase [Mucilaginibacter sp. dw_454]
MTWWHYLILVNFYLVLFFGFYAFLLRKETFFQLNRIYLVAAAILSFCIPIIQANWVKNLFITQQVQDTIYGGNMAAAVYNFTVKPNVSAQNSLTLGQIFNAIYIAVTVFLVLRLFWQLFVLKRSMDQPAPSAAYSFFKKISLGKNVSESSVIAEHEEVHAGQWHSVDVMIIELVMIINWFNPVVYLYRFAIKYIHEFIADRQVIEQGTDKVDYAMLLLSQTFQTDQHNLVTPFYNHSLLKERIKMLQKNKSNRMMLAKYGLSAPLFILMLILSSATVSNSKVIKVINKKTEKALQIPATSVINDMTSRSEAPVENKIESNKNKPVKAVAVDINQTDTVPAGNNVFSQVEKAPQFPGGMVAFGQFLSKAVHYPQVDRENKVQGKVICTFVVEKDGTLSTIKALRGPSETLKQAAVAALLQSPKWRPGVQNGRVVRVSYAVPVNFTLTPTDNETTPPTGEKIYNVVAKQPQFPGGIENFGKFLSNYIRFPKEDRENGVSGRVIATFVVEKDGSLSDIRVVRGPSERMGAEAVRVLSMSPKWIPGKLDNGQSVRVSYTVPINFTLSEESDNAPKSGVRVDSLLKKAHSKANSPLYVIDGVEYGPGKAIPEIKQENIASMEVLRDDKAIKLYGDRGKNGVIIITSKKKQ